MLIDGTLKKLEIENQEEQEKLLSIQSEIVEIENQIQQKQSEL